MATASSWRTGNLSRMNSGPNNGNSNNTHQQQPASPNTAATRSATNSMNSTYSPSNSTARMNNTDREPTEGDNIQRDRVLYLLVGLVGNTVVATTKSGIKYIGILSSTSTPSTGSESFGVVLSCAQQIFRDGTLGALKKMLMINGDDFDGLTAKDVGLDVPVSMSSSNRAGFRTDTEISKKALEPLGEGRLLQKWADDVEDLPLEAGSTLTGLGSGGSWDQFAANEARFGVKSNYEETMYTTKLDKTSKDFKEREKKADQLAREIMNSSTNNIHIAEERNLAAASDAQTEEDRYGAVVRGANAYVPPAARRAAAANAVSVAASNGQARQEKSNGATADTPEIRPALQIPTITNTPAGASEAIIANQPVIIAAPQHAPNAVGDFAHFVSSERERYEKKRAALAKKEKESRLADLKSWGDRFKLKFPPSTDGSPLSSNSAGKKEDSDTKGASTDTTGKKELRDDGKALPSPITASTKPSQITSASKSPSTQISEAKANLARMTIPKIPPFNPDKTRARQSEGSAAATPPVGKAPEIIASPSLTTAADASKANFKLSAKASTFKPFNPNATAFTPGGSGGGAATNTTMSPSVASPIPSAVRLPTPLIPAVVLPSNPFFGNRVLKKSTTLHVREEFNPFRSGKVPESQTVGPTWGFNGKGYRTLFQVSSVDDAGTSMNQIPMTSPLNMPPTHSMMQMSGMQSHPAAMVSQGSAGPQHMQQQPSQQQHISGPNQLPPQQQQQQQHNQQMAAGVMTASNGQQFYMPYGGGGGAAGQAGHYRFQGQPMQHLPAYGQMPPQYLPFTPPMQQSGPPPPTQMYSPQMGQMFPHSTSMHSMTGSPVPMGRNKGGPPIPPPQMYYSHAPFMPMTANNGGGGGGSHGPRSPGMRPQNSQSPQHMTPLQQQNSMPPSQHSGASSQAGSAVG